VLRQEGGMKERVIVLLLVFMVIVAVGSYWLSRSQEIMAGAQNALSAELANALGSLVTVGDIEITSYNAVTIHNVAIYDKQSAILATSDKVVISYSPWSILTGWNVVKSISELKVEKPTLWLTQRNNGQWNIEDIVIKDNTTQSSLSSKVKLVDGKAIVSAYNAQWILEELNGSLDFINNPSIKMELQGMYKGAALKAKGTINSQGRSTVTLNADQLLLADFQVLAPAEKPIKLVGGSGENVEVTIAYDKGNLEWAGEARLIKADVDLGDLPMRQIDGGIAFTNKKLYVFAAAKVFEQTIEVRGTVVTEGSEPILKLTVSSSDFDPSATGYNIPVKGRLSFKMDIAGITSNPVVIGDAAMESGELAGYQAQNVQATIDMVDKNITIHKFKAELFGGQVAATGQVQPEIGSYDLNVQAQHIDMKNFADLVPDLNGYVDGSVAVKGTGDLAGAEVQGTMAMGQGEFSGIPFASLTSGFYYHGGNAIVDYLNIGLGEQGMVTAKGTIEQRTLALQLYGHDIPLELFSKDLGSTVEGIGQFNGEIHGTLSTPEITANFAAVNGEILSQPFTQVAGIARITPQQVTLQNVEMINGVTRHNVQGTVALEGQKAVNMTISTQRARAETLIALLVPGERLTGNVDNEVIITGPLANPNVTGKITLTDGSFRGQLIARATGSYKREQGITTINDFVVQSLNTQIHLSGTISPDNDLNFDVMAEDIDLEKLIVNNSNYAASGKAKFKGKLTGTPTVPVFKGELSTDTLRVNQQEFTNVIGTIAVNGDEIEIPAISFLQGKGKFDFSGGFNKETSEVYGILNVGNAELQPLLAVSNVENKDIVGVLNGQVKVNGTLDNPTIHLTGNLKEGSIKKYPVESMTVDAALENNIVSISDFSIKQGTGVVLARGRADLNTNGPLDLEVGGRDIDAGLVAAFFNTSITPTGKLNFATQVSGVSNNPHTALSLELVNGGIGDATFDSLYGLLILDKDVIHVNQVLLKKGPYQASAYGVIPVAALSSEGRQQENNVDQMNLNVRLDQANLSILPLLTKEVTAAEGATQGGITITGTLKQPILNGSITVNNGILKLAALKDPIQKVGVDIAFEGDTINIKQFEGHMGSGLYRATGTAKLQGVGLTDYNISLVLDKPMIRSKFFSGTIDGKLMLTQGPVRPKLAGKFLFENDTIDIPTIPDVQPSSINMDLDVNFQIGKKVRFYNPYLYDILAAGSVKLGGSTVKPDVSGHIVAIQGTVSYLRTPFKVEEASVDFRQLAGSFEPVVKLKAQTTLQQTVINLNINGPIGEMEIKLTSEPAMNQQEILSLLTLRSRYYDKQNNGNNGLGRDELVGVLDAGLQMHFISGVEGNLRSALGLDEFSFVRDTSSTIVKKNDNKNEDSTLNQEVYNLVMSKYVTDKLLVSYTMGVDHTKNELAFRYGLNRRISLTGSIDDQNQTWLGAEARFRF
jgi:translocation and assembly module TamB